MPRLKLAVVDYTRASGDKFAPDRRPPGEVLPILDAPSPVGSSFYKSLLRCPREHAHYHVASIKQDRRREALDTGILWHAPLEAYYKAIQDWQASLEVSDVFGTTSGPDYFWGGSAAAEQKAFEFIEPLAREPGYEQTYETVVRVLGGYMNHYRRTDRWRIVAVEETLMYLIEGFEYSARLDLVVEDTDKGGLWIVEHKCYVGESLIRDARTGAVRSIRELAEKQIAPVVAAFDFATGTTVAVQAAIPEATSVRDVFEVATKSGRRLRCSSNHPFLTARGWIPASALTDQDWLVAPRDLGGWSKVDESQELDVDVLAFIGMMIGDGTLRAMCWTKSRGPVFDRFVRCLEILDSKYTIAQYDGKCPYVRISRKSPAAQLLRELGLDRARTAEKFIPRELLSLRDPAQVWALLGGLWDTDGCIHTSIEKSTRGEQAKVQITYVSRSHELGCGIAMLLQQVGLNATLTRSSVRYRGARRDVFYVKVVGRRSKREFLCAARTHCVRWNTATLNNAFEMVKDGDDDCVPLDHVARCADGLSAEAKHTLHLYPSQREKFHSVARWVLDQCGVTDNWNVIWDRVSSVVISGQEMMYNLEVPGHHNYVVNGLVTHNTARGITDDLVSNYQMDLQILGQVWLLRHCVDLSRYPTFKGVLVNIGTKAKTPRYERVECCPSDYHLASFEESMRRWVRLRNEFALEGWPRALGNCAGFSRGYTTCAFYDLCHGRPEWTIEDVIRGPLPPGYSYNDPAEAVLDPSGDEA